MRKVTTGFGLICCVAAMSFLGACSKNSDGCCKGDKAACTDSAAPGMVGEKKCSGEAGKCCKSGQASPGMVSEKSSCSGAAKKCCGGAQQQPGDSN